MNASSDSGRTFLLPIVNLRVGVGRNMTNVRCLLDTGSQRSYLSQHVMDKLNVKLENKMDMMVNTFIDSNSRQFFETSVAVKLKDRPNPVIIPFLINNEFDLSFTIEGLKEAHENISRSYLLQEKYNSDYVQIEGLVGVDLIQCLGEMKLVKCLGGSALQLTTGVVPIGNIDSFLSQDQLCAKYTRSSKSTLDDSPVNLSIVNFALNPVKSFFDPIGSVVSDSSVEDKLDKMFSVESLGISEETSDWDRTMIDKFDSNITMKDGKYHVHLPWNENINDVPHNFFVSKAILDRVVENLHSKDMYDDYDTVLRQQICDKILEPVSIDSINLDDHKFIPHRPVIKNEDNVTTKLRIVLNCSLRVGKSPSLNQAAYPGVDLVNNLLEYY